MKRILTAMAIAIAAGPAPALAEDYLAMPFDQVVEAAKEEGSLTFYAWWGEQYWRDAAADFSAKSGIDTKVIIGDLGPTVAKMLAEASSEAGTIDAFLVGGPSVKTLMDAGILYGPLLPAIPGGDKLDPKLAAIQEGVATGGFLVPEYRNQTGFLFDPEQVPTPPQSWQEFTAWLDANPGKFAFCDPTKGGSGEAFVQTALLSITGDAARYEGDTALDPAKIEDWSKAWEWFRANRDKFVVTASNNDSIDRLNQGEVAMISAWDDDTAIALAKGTLFKRAKLYIPAMGMPGGGDTIGIPKNAPHKAAALAFIAYLAEPESQKAMNATIGSYLARTDVSGESALLPETERQMYGAGWLPSPYKARYAEDFVKEVLMK